MTNPLLSRGFVRHTARNFGLERPNVYLLQVEWDRLEDDTQGFPRLAPVPGMAPVVAPFLRARRQQGLRLVELQLGKADGPVGAGQGCLGSLLAGR